MKIYVGNLPYDAKEEDLRQLFEAFGQVNSINLITDRDTGRSKGFGFVEMENQEEGDKAITELNDTELSGRKINISVARPKKEFNKRFNNRNDSSRRFNSNRY